MPTEEQVVEALKEIIDPHTNMNIYEMGLISEIEVTDESVSLTFRPTSPFCPLGIHLALNIKRRLREIGGTGNADVKVVGHIHEEQINDELRGS
jgi:metal-sulfur cluster biosynthetic enzyme